MISNPLISVIMAIYNGEKYLPASIKSILDQTYTNYEFIIINDGSFDRTGQILSEYEKKDKRIKIVSQANNGLAYSLNVGIQMARGEFIARMDADDIARPNRLEEQCRVMLARKRIGLCHSLFGLIGEEGKAVPFRRRSGFRFSALQTRWTLIWRNCICHPSVMMRRKVLEDNNLLYDPEVICQDYDLWCRLIEVTDFHTVLKPLILLRKHAGSVSANYNERYLSTFSSIIAKNLINFTDKVPGQDDLRTITLLSGQMYLRGKDNTDQINAEAVLAVFEDATSKFSELHALNQKEVKSIQQAAGQQLIRWSQQACYHNKKAAAKFLFEGLSRYFTLRSN